MANNTKTVILDYLRNLTRRFDFEQAAQFTAHHIGGELHISRSLASLYLNELVKENLIMKVNSRPVYFLHRKAMEELYQIEFQEDDFYDLDEVRRYILDYSPDNGDYTGLVGNDRSLNPYIRQIRESFEYPPNGLPVIVYGEEGVGKKLLCSAIYENGVKKGILEEGTELVSFEFSRHNSQALRQKLFGTKEKQGIIDRYDRLVLMLGMSQHMSEEFQERLCSLMEMTRDSSGKKGKYQEKQIRYFILCDTDPEPALSERLIKNIPVMVRIPNFKERSLEEKEELVIHFIRKEGERLEASIKISSVVLRALVNGDYSQNMAELKRVVQLMCAGALKASVNKKEIIVHSYNLPEHILETMPIATDEDIVYIDTSSYRRSDQFTFISNYLARIFKPFQKKDFKESFKESKHSFDLLIEYLSFKQRVPPEKIQGMETFLVNLFEVIVKKKFVNLPGGFCFNLAKVMYTSSLYRSSFDKWIQKHRAMIEGALSSMRANCVREALIVDELIRLIRTNLEVDADEILTMMMIVYLYHYNIHIQQCRILGLIACHGYSTATSIADAVNALLGTYVFDAIDMPLNTSAAQVKKFIIQRLERMRHQTDVIVMVDTGSLEQLGDGLSTEVNCNMGIINNVSTRLALDVGNHIIRKPDTQIQTILERVSADSTTNYRMISRRRNSAILFTSEGGFHMASRMRDLFESSFTNGMPVELEVCDFNQLVSGGPDLDCFKNRDVLFITGTTNPHVKGYEFVALEDIISGNNIHLIMNRLSRFLDMDELNEALDLLRKNFTLQNVVRYLTILNPKILLDNVSQAVDTLQAYLNQRFGGKILIGIYIHVCCLVERLVTKSAISEFERLEDFEKEHGEFIQYVNQSFQELSKSYNVTIPVSEIAYLYDFIVEDGQL